MLFSDVWYTEVFLRVRGIVKYLVYYSGFIAKYCRNSIWSFDEFEIEFSLANMKIIICDNFMIF